MSNWYSYNRLLSHNGFINVVLSPRGNGKSYGAKKMIIDDFLKKGYESVYVRRTKVELDKAKKTFFNDIKKEYPNHEFKIQGDVGLIDGEVLVHFIPLSTSNNLKSSSYPLVSKIFFDEYIITQTSHSRYLKNEMTLFYDLIETVFRKRTNTKVIIMSNAVSFVNPLFTDLNIEPKPDERFQKFCDNLVVLELFTDENFIKEKQETPFGRLIAHKDYGRYAISNTVLEDNNEYILPKKYHAHWSYHLTLKAYDFTIGVWADYLDDVYYIDKNIHTDATAHNYHIYKDDVASGYYYLGAFRNKEWRIKHLKKAYNEGRVYYVSQEVKKFFINTVMSYM